MVSALVAAGAQPDVNVVSASSERSALYAATKGGHEAGARQLIVAGADVTFFLGPCRRRQRPRHVVLSGW